MDKENDYNPCLSPYDIQNGGIYDHLSNGRVIYLFSVRQQLLRATIVGQVVKGYLELQLLDLSKWETIGLGV